MTPVAIVGGGISGLAAAYQFSKAGVPSTIIESRPRLGGLIETRRVGDCLVEGGPDSFLAAKPEAIELIRELGMAGQVIASNDHQRRTFILKRGRLEPLPDGLFLMVPTRLRPLLTSPLLSWPAKLRMAADYFRRPASRGERSVAEFVREHYGDEALDYLAEPLLAGVYGGDPAGLSAASVLPKLVELEARYGSLTRGILAERKAERKAAPSGAKLPLFQSLRDGMGSLVDALSAKIGGAATVIGGRAESIERRGSGFAVRVNGEWLEARQLILACEAHAAAALAGGLDSELARLLGGIRYSSSMIVALGFEAAAFRRLPEGFGFLVPRRERRKVVAGTWVGAKFPHRAPPGRVLLRCFLGGVHDPGVLSANDGAVVATVLEELRGIAALEGAPLFSSVYRWPDSMAQYSPGHGERLRRIEERLQAIPALRLAGNAYSGIGIPDCIRTGRRAAGGLLRTVRT